MDVEAALDGIYVVRTSLPEERMEAQDAVRSYKLLGRVESAFRAFKSIDLKVRPIHHHLEDRVRAHIFLCMLAYYVQWHMIEAWRPLLFADEDQEAKATRDPVAPAKRSQAAQRKVRSKTLDDGSQGHSFHTLLVLLSGIVRNVCIIPSSGPEAPTFDVHHTQCQAAARSRSPPHHPSVGSTLQSSRHLSLRRHGRYPLQRRTSENAVASAAIPNTPSRNFWPPARTNAGRGTSPS